MKVGLVVYSDMTEVEVVCVHECLAKVWQLDFPNPPENHLIGVTPEVIGWNGIVIKPHHHFPEVDLAGYDLLVVPGGWAGLAGFCYAGIGVVEFLAGWKLAKVKAAHEARAPRASHPA